MPIGTRDAATSRRRTAPTSIRPRSGMHLSDIFILAADFVEEQRFRLAGTRVCALFARELKGESFASLVGREEPGPSAGTAGERHRRTMPPSLPASSAAMTRAIRSISNCCCCHSCIKATPGSAPSACWRRPSCLTGSATGRSRNSPWAPSVTSAASSTTSPGGLRPHLGGQLRRGFMVYQGGAAPPPVSPPRDQAG